jgi:hypothetical protein
MCFTFPKNDAFFSFIGEVGAEMVFEGGAGACPGLGGGAAEALRSSSRSPVVAALLPGRELTSEAGVTSPL